VLVLPNGEVIGAKGKKFSSNNGTTYSVMSPLDFWAPGSGLLTAGIRGLTGRITAAAVRGFRAMVTASSEELALWSARALSTTARLSRTLPGMAVSARGLYAVEHAAGRTFLLGEDMAIIRAQFAHIPTEAGFHDLVLHGTPTTFKAMVREASGAEVWREVSIREVADAVRSKLPPGVRLRLLACDAGEATGGAAQQLANELNRTVWGANSKVWTAQEATGNLHKAFVPRPAPDGPAGVFHEFVPERGAAALKGAGGNVTSNEVAGEINRIHPRPPR
jgi:hypothetical protein